jgi:PAS domain S-box-containing protein
MPWLADMIEKREADILGRWAARVRERLSWTQVSHAELIAPLADDLNELLALARGPPADTSASRQHGAQRFRLGVTLEALMTEYQQLLEVLADMAEEEGPPRAWPQLRRLMEFSTPWMASALGAFCQEQARSRAEAERDRSRLAAVFTQAPVAIAILRGPELLIELANPRVCRLWGRTAEQVMDLPLLQALPELRGQEFDAILRRVLATGEPFVGTELLARLVRTPGEPPEDVYFNFVYEVLRDAQGGIDGVVIVATEVTREVLARREVEQLLERSQHAERARSALLEALDAQSLVAVAYQRGPQHVYEMTNPAFRRFAIRDVMGQPLLAVFPEAVTSGLEALLDRVFHSGEPQAVWEMPLRMTGTSEQDAHEGVFTFSFQPVRGARGEVEGVLTLVLEVTELVHARQEAQRLAEEERHLRDFEEQLLGIVSHDLRNPLHAILMAVHVLRGWNRRDARLGQALSLIQQSAERSVRMVHDLLDFTQARLGGGIRLERRPVDLHEVARGALTELRATHPGRQVQLVQRGNAQGEWDGDRLAQVVDNLVGNALKYSPPDSPVVVRTVGDERDVLLEVHNDGPAIPYELVPQLFEPLRRGPAGVDREARSVGLGLYIVDQIVRAHGGGVHVVSREKDGTTFRVLLPRQA